MPPVSPICLREPIPAMDCSTVMDLYHAMFNQDLQRTMATSGRMAQKRHNCDVVELFKFEDRGVEQGLFPYVWQMLLNLYVDGLLDGPDKVMWFPTHNSFPHWFGDLWC